MVCGFSVCHWSRRKTKNMGRYYVCCNWKGIHVEKSQFLSDPLAIVPPSLAAIAPILRVATEFQDENPRVAYLCRFYAFEMVHRMDPTSSGRWVPQFKTYMLNKLKKEGELTEELVKRSETKELQAYYRAFYEKRIQDGEMTQNPEEMAKNVLIATVLYEMVKDLVAEHRIEKKTKRYAAEVENKWGQYEHYNILPLYAINKEGAIRELSEGSGRKIIKSCCNMLCMGSCCFGGGEGIPACSRVCPHL